MMNRLSVNNGQFILHKSSPLLIIISGPSGVGKDAILNRMKERKCPFEFVTTVTTRTQRANEKQQIDYHFISVDKFQDLLKNEGLLEWANVYGNFYGVPKSSVKDALLKGRDTVIKVDVQGAANIKKIVPDAIFIFIAPPSIEELSNRLISRCTENTCDLELRLKTAENELHQMRNFDYIVMNSSNKIDSAVEEILSIVTAEKCRATPRNIAL
jgi:guanylate kinase